MADISRYSLQFVADPSQAISAFGKVGDAAQQSANRVNTAFKAAPQQSFQSNGMFKQMAGIANFKGMQGSIGNIASQFSNLSSVMGPASGVLGQFGGTLSTLATSGGPVTMAIAAIAALAAITIIAANHIDQLDDTSKRLGITVAQLQTMQLAAGEAGVEFEQLSSIMMTMGNTLADAQAGLGQGAKALQELGLNASELLGMNPEQRLVAISNRMRELNLSIEQQGRLWSDLGGRLAGRQFVAFAANMSENLATARHELQMMNAAVGQNTASIAAYLTDMVGRLRLILDSIGSMLVSSVGPLIAAIVRAVQGLWMMIAPILSLAMQILGIVLKPIVFVINLLTVSFRIIGAQLQVLGVLLSALFKPLELIFGIFEGILATLEPVFREVEAAFLEVANAIKEVLDNPAVKETFMEFARYIASYIIPAIRWFAETVKWLAQKIKEAREFVQGAKSKAAGGIQTAIVTMGMLAPGGGFGFAAMVANMIASNQQTAQVVQTAIGNLATPQQAQVTPWQQSIINGIMQVANASWQIVQGVLNMGQLLLDGQKLIQETGGQFNFSQFEHNIRALQAAFQSGTGTQGQFQTAIGRQLQSLRQYVGSQQREVGQRAMLEGSVEAVTMQLQTQYGQGPRDALEEMRDLLNEARLIQQAELAQAQLQTAALQQLVGNNPFQTFPLNI